MQLRLDLAEKIVEVVSYYIGMNQLIALTIH